VKAFVSLVVPQWGMRSLERVSPERSREFVGAGVMFLAISAVLWYLVLAR
jgi:hypothetical protein